MHRVTCWIDEEQNTIQVAVACLNEVWEPLVEATEQVSPFESTNEALDRATEVCHRLCPLAHQGVLFT